MQTDQPLDQQYWDSLWESNQTAWDIGYASPAIVDYMSQYPNKGAAILIPGCGNAYEAAALVGLGFTNITLIDISSKAVENIKGKFVNSSQVTILCQDFFEHTGNYDLIIEQTFFCALPPDQRTAYVKKTSSLLKNNGKLIGLLFNRSFDKPGPPFGGSIDEYKLLFESSFMIKKMEHCYNSIAARSGHELFVNLTKI